MTRLNDGCELCGDQQELALYSRCHFTAPLKAVKTKKEIILSCYVPECGKEVARLPLANEAMQREATRLIAQVVQQHEDLGLTDGKGYIDAVAWLNQWGRP